MATPTLAALWQRISEEIGGFISGTTTNTGTTTTFMDSTLADFEDQDRRILGKFARPTSGDEDGNEREISGFNENGAASTVTVRRAWDDLIASSVTYAIHPFKVADITAKINEWRVRVKDIHQVITDTQVVTRDNTHRYPVKSTIINNPHQIWIENGTFSYQEIHKCDNAWDESTGTGVTVALDNRDFQWGNGSVKITVTSAASAGDILATDNVSSMDLSDHIGVRFSIKSDIATTAGDLQLILSETANGASATETLDVPALVAGKWEVVEVSYAGATTSRDAIISVGIKYVTDLGAMVINVDNIQSITTNPDETLADMKRWTQLRNWNYQTEGHEVYFPYALPANRRLRMIGKGLIAADLSANSPTSTVEADETMLDYLYALVLADLSQVRMFQSVGSEREEYEKDRNDWLAIAAERKRRVRVALPQRTEMSHGWTYTE